MVLSLCFLARGTNSDDVNGIALCLEASGQALGFGLQAELLFADVHNALALRADQVMMAVVIHLYAQRAVMQADFLQNTAFEK